MATACTCLNFVKNTEQAFNFYKSVSGGDLQARCRDESGVQWMFNCTEK